MIWCSLSFSYLCGTCSFIDIAFKVSKWSLKMPNMHLWPQQIQVKYKKNYPCMGIAVFCVRCCMSLMTGFMCCSTFLTLIMVGSIASLSSIRNTLIWKYVDISSTLHMLKNSCDCMNSSISPHSCISCQVESNILVLGLHLFMTIQRMKIHSTNRLV